MDVGQDHLAHGDGRGELGRQVARLESHRGPLRERFVVDGGRPSMERLDPAPWPDAARAEPVEVEAGTLVLLHGLLPHWSAPNRSAHSRHAYTLHAVDGRARYSPRNWLQRSPDFPARGF